MLNLSLVVPVYNEEENLSLLSEAIHKVLDPLPRSWEVVYVDDGSIDGSLDVLNELAKQDPHHVRVVSFRRNFGQTAAIVAGLDYSRKKTAAALFSPSLNSGRAWG